MSNDNQKWVSIEVTSPVNFGDRITVGGAASSKEGLVTGFIGKERETVVVQFDETPNHSVTIKKELITDLKRQLIVVERLNSSKKSGQFRSKSRRR